MRCTTVRARSGFASQQKVVNLLTLCQQIAIFNGVLFVLSMLAFIGIVIDLGLGRKKLIAEAIHLPLPGCPVVDSKIQWSEWIPGMLRQVSLGWGGVRSHAWAATIFEFILFSFALFKYMSAPDFSKLPTLKRVTKLSFILVGDNMLYFLGSVWLFYHLVLMRMERLL